MKFDFTKYKKFYTADFETSTPEWGEDEARVWLWDICDTSLNHKHGNSLDSFMEHILDKVAVTSLFAFHNLAYDGTYILSWLLNHGYKYRERKDTELWYGQFSTVISDLGQHYAYVIRSKKALIYIMDSYKYIHFSVRDIAVMYNLPILKGEIDYTLFREVGHIPTDEELSYIHNDTEIMMRAIQIKLDGGETKWTQAGNARAEFKKSIDNYDSLFPQIALNVDKHLRKAYYGGFTYTNPLYACKDLGECISLDCNSMYPAQMLHEFMPYGEPEYYDGKYENDSEYPIYIQTLRCIFSIKENKTPSISVKRLFSRIGGEYLLSSNFETAELTLCTPDLELFFDNYDVWNITYLYGYKFKAMKGYEVSEEEAKSMTIDDIIEADGKGSYFYNYFKKWRMIKEHNEGAVRTNAKLMQNALYGAMASNPLKRSQIPYLGEDGLLKYKVTPEVEGKGVYLPASIFITAYARKMIIGYINMYIKRFVYCDTDSLYLLGHDIPTGIKIHNSLYGFFKIEHIIDKARFLGAKRYIYYARTPKEEVYSWSISCCGADSAIKQQMDWDNFKPNAIFDGKKQIKTVKGGKHISTTTYMLKV